MSFTGFARPRPRSHRPRWLPLLCTATAVLAAPGVPAAAAATTYSVSPGGSDAAPGTASAPFATIGKAASVARAGDTVLVGSGRYAEQVTLGSAGSGVTFRGTGATRPVIDGGGTRQYGFRNAGANDARIEHFEVTGQTNAGIYIQGLRDVVADNVVHDVGSPAVSQSNGIRVVWGGDARVTGNVVHSIGPGGESMGIWLVETKDARVDGNTVYLVRKEGVRDWKGLDNAITDNRLLLNWVGIALNTATGSVVTNNYTYDNVTGIAVKHASYQSVLDYWKLTEPHTSRVWHNTTYRNSDASIWLAQSDQPLDFLDVRDNLLVDAGAAHVRDVPSLRGPHVVVDGNAYVYPTPDRRPFWLYKAGWSSAAGLSSWDEYRTTLGWEANGRQIGDAGLLDPGAGNLDYAATSLAAAGSIDLPDALRAQLGARGLPAAPVRWTPYAMTPVDSSSKGTWSTTHYLDDSADDNAFTAWTTATAANEFVTYDLGARRTISHLVLTPFAHNDMRTPHGYRFEVSDDRSTWRTVLEGENADANGSSFKYELPAPVTARYLRYTMRDTSCTSYAPRTGCGTTFVLADLKAGLVTP